MLGHAVVIQPERAARTAATELLEKEGFAVTELSKWPRNVDAVISHETGFVLIEAKMVDRNREFLKEIRDVSDALPVIIVGPEKLSKRTMNEALGVGMVQYAHDLEKAVDAALQTLRAISARHGRGSSPARRIEPLAELHDPDTGRVDAARVAEYLGVPLAFMATALDRNYSTVAKTPSAESLQEPLHDFKRVVEVLQHVLGDAPSVRIWMNTPHPDLGNQPPRKLAERGDIAVVRRLIDGTLGGTLS